MDDNSKDQESAPIDFWKVFLEKWVPSLITAGIGGAMVAFLVPGIQASYASKAALHARHVTLWEAIGANFTNFTNSNFQLVTVAREIRTLRETTQAIPDDLVRRREEYRQARDSHASKLNADLIVASFYFGKPILSLAAEYRTWVLSISTATIDTMPPRSEFDGWRDRFLTQIGTQLSF